MKRRSFMTGLLTTLLFPLRLLKGSKPKQPERLRPGQLWFDCKGRWSGGWSKTVYLLLGSNSPAYWTYYWHERKAEMDRFDDETIRKNGPIWAVYCCKWMVNGYGGIMEEKLFENDIRQLEYVGNISDIKSFPIV